MRHAPSLRLLLILVLVALVLLPQASAAAPAKDEAERPLYAPGEVLIGWQPGNGPVPEMAAEPDRLGTDRASPTWQAAAATISRATRLTVLDASPEHGTARLSVPIGTEEAQIRRLETLPWVRYAEFNYYAYAADVVYPRDPDFWRQWNMHRIKAPEAWSMTRGSLSFVVAVLDTGVAQGHPEFAGQLLEGYNYVADAPGAEDDDAYSHGTHVTGILAARMNNGQGVAGLAPDIKILPLKVLDSQRKGRYDAIGAALRDAADRRAQVINLSLAGPASQLLQDAVKYAQAEGSLVVAAAGNCAQDPTNCWGQVNPDIYPAAYDRVLAVSASDRFDRPAIYSGYKYYIGLAAPGGTSDEPVWSTTRGGYGPLYGTSMSTPLVSAAAALVWALRPAATADEIAGILKNTADKVGSDPYSGQPLSYTGGRNDYFGSGRLNVAIAVRWAYPPSLVPATGQIDLLLGGATTSATRSIEITNPSGQSVTWQATVVSPTPWLKLDSPAGGISVYGSSAFLTLRAESFGLDPSVYAGTIRLQPVNRTDVAPVVLTVVMRVSATLNHTYAPVLTQGLESAWLDPDAPGSLYRYTLPLANDRMMTMPLPFPVNFYGSTQQILQVSDNGFVIFGPANGASGRTPAECPGSALPPNNAIYVLANDWDSSLGGQIVVHRPDSYTYVVTWQDVRRTGSSPPQSFQLVITSDSTFGGNYRAVESPLPGIIGAENLDAAFTQQVLCNGAGRQVKSGESVRFTARLPW
jgi:thermitase